ncbi:MAG: hypothetical protein H6624_07885 [Bdellovibrionaceae bacterium]|nr:hypothetical protein [Bdellovibrionales bacterium]MCB9084251.1 hypothetical protein [Pseudobdellovibrionaceae bacterium]
MKYFGFFALILAVPFLGCSPGDRLREVHWDSKLHQPLTAEIATIISTPRKDSLRKTKVMGHQVEHWRGMAGGFPVADTWVKVVRDEKGAPQFVRAQLAQLDPIAEDVKKAQQLEKRKQFVLGVAWKKYPELRTAKKIFPVQVVLDGKMVGYEPHLEVTYFNADETDVIRLKLSGTANILERKSLAQHLANGSGMVFLGFPDRTKLTEVEFMNLVGDGTLNSETVKVESDTNSRAYSPSHEFRFTPAEQPFDEVQAYYFVESALKWLSKDFGFVLPFKLNVKVHVGGLRPSNAAFYYKGNIRLGDGDNVVYRNIPRDPSIVIHEAAHGVVDAVAGLPHEKEGGSMNEGYSDFIAALFLDNPKMAEYSYLKAPFRRTLENDLQAFRDFNGGLYHDSTVVSGTMWDLRKALGIQLAGKLALTSLAHMGPGSGMKDFAPSLLSSVEEVGLDESQVGILQGVLNKRGWL